MKKATVIFVLFVAFAIFVFTLYWCFGRVVNRGVLDTTDIPVANIGEEADLIRNKTFAKNTEEQTQDFYFSTILVQSFKFRAMYDGTYTFSVQPEGALSVYMHTGNLITDWWQELPCIQPLYGGLEYTIEVKLNDTSYLNQNLQIKIVSPPTNTKNISDCVSFTDPYTKGDIMYYDFTATRDGEYTFRFADFLAKGDIRAWKEGRRLTNTAWGGWSKKFTVGEHIRFEIEPYSNYNKPTLEGFILHPPLIEDISEAFNEKNCLILDMKPVSGDDQIMFVSLTASNSPLDIVISAHDVGKKEERKNQYFTVKGYGTPYFKIDDKWYNDDSVDYSLGEGDTLTIEIKVQHYESTTHFCLFIYEKSVERTYLEF